MNIEQHIAHRAWAFQALDALEVFLDDPDFVGDKEEEARIIGRKRRELKEGKYRVVILGEFNVGKSALVNAFLGEEYLPMVLEECTTKITHIIKSDDMRVVLNLSTPVSEEELETLARLVAACGVTADVLAGEDMNQVVIAFPSNQGRDLVRTLRPLVTLTADEDFPQLRSFRGKFDELHIYLPTDLLADDVALVDSPGVHSISETNNKIAEEIIPNSHLVICLLDSQNPGTEHNREFIEKVVKHRHRKVMFVINKADQLNEDEIDPKGHRGPAKDLFRSLRGVVESPEIFFVSALYALVSSQLSRFQTTLEDLDGNNKIKIPWALQRELMLGEDPAAGVAEYLMEKSNITTLRDRLLRYLYTENREGAILESACRFIDEKAWTYARPIQVQLDMARDVPRLAELNEQSEILSGEIADGARRAEAVSSILQDMSGGGVLLNGREYPGYEKLLDSRVTEETVQRAILDPAREWLCDDLNYKNAKQNGFTPLAAKVESLAGAFLQNLYRDLNLEVYAVEDTALTKMGASCPSDPVRHDPFETPGIQIQKLSASLAGSYFGFIIGGAVLGAAIGAGTVAGGVWGELPDMNMALQMAAGAGAAAGVLVGLVLRAATAKSVVRKKLTASIREQVQQLILGSKKGIAAGRPAAIKGQLREALLLRRAEFSDYIRDAFEQASQDMRARLAAILEEEDELRRKQEEIIARLEPKLADLAELGGRAVETAQVNGPNEIETIA